MEHKRERQEYEERSKADFNAATDRFFKNDKLYHSYLKPCPFCGNKDQLRILFEECLSQHINYYKWKVKCSNCGGMKEQVINDLENIILSWNKRVSEKDDNPDYWEFCRELEKKGVIFPEGYIPD